jgi:DNA-binding transcriptional ArsR family regulator
MAAIRGERLKQIIDPTLAKAFTHPLRSHVWVTICERGIVSPKEIAEEIGLEVSEVSYHFRGLKDRRLIRLVRIERRRGFVEHFYAPMAPPFFFERAWLEVDNQGWEEAMLTVREAHEHLLEIEARSARRRGSSSRKGIPMAVVMAAFETGTVRGQARPVEA